MKISAIIGLLLTVLAVSACVIEPYGGHRGYYGGHERGVWRG